MKKNTIVGIFCMFAIPIFAQEYYLSVTLTQEIYELAQVKFGGVLSDEQAQKGLFTDIITTRSLYSTDESFGCPNEKEPPTKDENEALLYKGKIVIVELEGECPYGQKIAKAEEEGAVAVIILQKEKIEKEDFFLEPDEFVEKTTIPCFVLKDFEQNERLFMYAPSPALIYFAKSTDKGKIADNKNNIIPKQPEAEITNNLAQWSISPNPVVNEAIVPRPLNG